MGQRGYSYDPLKWDEFKKKYKKELDEKPEEIESFIKSLEEHKRVTFVYGAKDTKHTHALVLKKYVEKRIKS